MGKLACHQADAQTVLGMNVARALMISTWGHDRALACSAVLGATMMHGGCHKRLS